VRVSLVVVSFVVRCPLVSEYSPGKYKDYIVEAEIRLR
jgi:hypothetical protein